MGEAGAGRRKGAMESQTISPFRRGTARVCKVCHSSLSSSDGECPECKRGGPALPDTGDCTSCRRPVATGRRACPHCGEPAPRQGHPPGKRLRRCRKCAKMVSIDAEICPGCKTERPAPPTSVPTCASCKLPVGISEGPCPRCGAPDVRDKTQVVRCTECDGPVSRALSHCPRCPYTGAVAPVEKAHCPTCDQPLADPDAPCQVCARRVRQQASRKGRCGHCGRPLRPDASCDCRSSEGTVSRTVRALRPLKALLASRLLLLVLLAVAAAWAWRQMTDPSSERAVRQRAMAMMGAKATEADVQALERDAAEIGVPLQWMVRAQRYCVFEPERRPSNRVLKLVVEGTRAAGGDAEKVLVETVRTACAAR